MLIPLTIYLLCVIAPVVYCLGQTVPIIINLWRPQLPAGKIGGQVLHLSTIGSFLGATLTALILLNLFGVGWSVFINFCFLVLLTLFHLDIKNQTLFMISLVTLGSIIFNLNISFESDFFALTNNYSNFQVVTKNTSKGTQQKFLISNNRVHSCLLENNKGCAYIEKIKQLLFFLPRINGEFVANDARHFIHSTSQLFDVIISDAYQGIALPIQLATQEYFREIKSHLHDNGLAIFNIIARADYRDTYSRHMDNTIRSVFYIAWQARRYLI